MIVTNPNLTQTLIERSKSFKEPYEFVFKINDNIIVQRFFVVKPYNPLAEFSYELRVALEDCTEIIKTEMKNRALDFMDEFKYYFAEDPNFDTNSCDDNYYFQIKADDKVIIQTSWAGTVYPAKIRYDVNIKKQISRIINIIQNVLSLPNHRLNTNYLQYSLITPEYAASIAKTK